MKRILKVGTLICLLFCFSCTQTDTTISSIKLAHGLDPAHPVHKAMVFMADTLNSISGGKMSMQIFPSGQLGDQQQCLELLQIGSIGITKVAASVMESFSSNYQVLGLPYIFRSKQHSFNVLDGPIGKEFLNSTIKYKLKGLCFYDAGARSFYMLNKNINSPADLKGQKIRVMKSQTAVDMVSAMGGAPTPISWGELYTALQTGVVDGAENNPPSLVSSRHYEVCKYYSINEHTRVPDLLIISTVVWNKLTDQQQKWLQKAADASVIKERELWQQAEVRALRIIKEAGVELSYPDKLPFMKSVESLLEKYKDEKEFYSLIQRIKATK